MSMCAECGDRAVQETGCERTCLCCALCIDCSPIAIESLIERSLDLIDKDDPERALSVLASLTRHDIEEVATQLLGRAWRCRHENGGAR